MHKSRTASLATMAAMLAISAGMGALVSSASGQVVEARVNQDTARVYGASPGSPVNHNKSVSAFARGAWGRLRGTSQRRAGPGWTNAHAKRVADKKRRVKAHRSRG